MTADANARAVEAMASLLARHTGFVLSSNRGLSAEAAIRRAMARAGVTDPVHYLSLLRSAGTPLDDLVAELVVGETYFLREPKQWELLRETILPDLAARTGPDHVMRCWSAGCASGEEAYTLAIALDEAGWGARSEILATDVSRPALARARQGTYTTWSLRNVSEAFAATWFRRDGERFAIAERIRRRVRFEYLNLAVDAYPSPANATGSRDVILCRNVLIYLDRATIARVAENLYASLAPGGWLICGSSDPSLSSYAPFESVVTPDGIFYRRQEPREPARAARGVEPERSSVASLPPPAPPPRREPRRVVDRSVTARAPRSDDDAPTWVARLRALATRDGSVAAEREAVQATARYPLDPELRYLHGMLLLDLGRTDDALIALRRVVYLDRSLAVAHFALGTLHERAGDAASAYRAYRNAARLAAARPEDELALLSDGEPYRAVAAGARARAELLAGRVREEAR